MHPLPSNERMYRALVERDATFAGVFVVGVKTTGIFCRVGCPARRPKSEHCQFFGTPREAIVAGYRACLRCRPLEREHGPSDVVRRLLAVVDAGDTPRIDTAGLCRMGIDPSTARRSFLRHCGMTFQAYQRARRMGLALEAMRAPGKRGRTVEKGMQASRYGSTSGFGAAFTELFGQPPSKASAVRCLLAERIATPLGMMVAVADESRLLLLEFHDRRALPRELTWLRRHHQAAIVPGRNAILEQLAEELAAYFDGRLARFRTPFAVDGTPFEQAVWQELLRIPCGETRSYAALAKALGQPKAVRAVGRANGANRIALLIPCHRVIRADGGLCGYGGGLWRKERLIELERQAVLTAP
jgi:AraC family transcriptional regulator of adaptative response/methylated-DNA-[protein]-cysteine methyltransferase